MIDFANARRMMVDGQVRTSDVTDLDLIAAMLGVPRERFVPASKAAVAYLDRDVVVAETGRSGRCLLKPMVLAKLIQAAQVGKDDKVLDVGCATGYSSAVLGRLAATVVALEQDAAIAGRAKEVLGTVGATNVTVVSGPLDAGCPALGPYDVILVNGAMEVEPVRLFGQLKDGGRLVGIFGADLAGRGMIYRRDRGEVAGRDIFNAAAPVLPGFVRPPTFVF